MVKGFVVRYTQQKPYKPLTPRVDFSGITIEEQMSQLLVTGLSDDLTQRLQMQASRHGRALPEEARLILLRSLPPQSLPVTEPVSLGEAFWQLGERLRAEGLGIELELPKRRAPRKSPFE
ncbi:MAG: hypothetical protein LBB58_05385 [Cellulomonadaceae bacterium]|jgi:plasmid stability protein|nr:hypothetical protein [Cellulomonadaceae bacterium]